MDRVSINMKSTKSVYKDPKIGRIIEFPNSKTVIIDVGQKNSIIKIGDKLVIYEEGPEILSNGNVIGRYDFKKEIINVTDVYENFSVCKKLVTYTKSTPTSSMISILNPREVTESVELKIDPTEIKNWKIKDPIIRKYDPVKFY